MYKIVWRGLMFQMNNILALRVDAYRMDIMNVCMCIIPNRVICNMARSDLWTNLTFVHLVHSLQFAT